MFFSHKFMDFEVSRSEGQPQFRRIFHKDQTDKNFFPVIPLNAKSVSLRRAVAYFVRL